MKKRRLDFTKRNKMKNETVGFMELEGSNDTANLYIYGDIVSTQWEKWEQEDRCPQDIVDFLDEIEDDADLTVYVNSGGGDVFAGIGIYNILKRHKGHIRGVVDGMAASIASTILMACDTITVSTGAQIMIHKPWTFEMGNANDFAATISRLDKCQEMITDIYMEKALEGVERDSITEKINAETWMSGEEAAQLFDIETDQKAAIAACATYTLDRCKKVPDSMKIKSVEEAEEEKRRQNEIDELLNDLYMYGV